MTQPGARIVVVGTSGSGKSTLARSLGARLQRPVIELDALHWGPHWTERPDFEAQIAAAIAQPAWVIDGNYSRGRALIWPRADTIVWLDYHWVVIYWRLLWRTLRRVCGQQVLWAGNRESWRRAFMSRDSLFVWVYQTYGRRKREYGALQRDPAWAHLRWIHLTTPAATARWLAALPAAAETEPVHA